LSFGVTPRKEGYMISVFNDMYNRYRYLSIMDDLFTPPVRQKHIPRDHGFIVPEAVVIHYTAGGSLVGAENTFMTGPVSAHLIVDRDGSMTQMVPFHKKALHAGVSEWKGRESFNSFSIGIELVNWGFLIEESPGVYHSWANTKVNVLPFEGRHKNPAVKYGYWEPYTCHQYLACRFAVRALQRMYNITWILGHDDIAPNRKQDPGPAFFWDQIGGKKT